MSTTPDPETLREANRNKPPVDSWIDDAPITDRQLDVLRAELGNRFVAQFNKDVVRKLVHSVELARAAADEQPRDERDAQLADLATELDAANANAAEIADQRTEYREEIMRLRARVRELEGAPAADDTTRVDAPRHADDTPHAKRLAQIRERNRRLRNVPFETHGGGHGPGCIPCELVRAIGDASWLLEQLAGMRDRVAADIEAWAEGIGWYEDGGVWADAIDVARTGRRHADEVETEGGERG